MDARWEGSRALRSYGCPRLTVQTVAAGYCAALPAQFEMHRRTKDWLCVEHLHGDFGRPPADFRRSVLIEPRLESVCSRHSRHIGCGKPGSRAGSVISPAATIFAHIVNDFLDRARDGLSVGSPDISRSNIAICGKGNGLACENRGCVDGRCHHAGSLKHLIAHGHHGGCSCGGHVGAIGQFCSKRVVPNPWRCPPGEIRGSRCRCDIDPVRPEHHLGHLAPFAAGFHKDPVSDAQSKRAVVCRNGDPSRGCRRTRHP